MLLKEAPSQLLSSFCPKQRSTRRQKPPLLVLLVSDLAVVARIGTSASPIEPEPLLVNLYLVVYKRLPSPMLFYFFLFFLSHIQELSYSLDD